MIRIWFQPFLESVPDILCVGCHECCFIDENQRLCASVFPHAVKFLEVHENPAIIRPIASLISLAAANNGVFQNLFPL